MTDSRKGLDILSTHAMPSVDYWCCLFLSTLCIIVQGKGITCHKFGMRLFSVHAAAVAAYICSNRI